GREIVAQQTRNSAAETVDRLVRIADHDESRCRLRRGDQTQQLELSRVYILELVDQHESEFRLHPRAKRRTGLQQLDGFRDVVAKDAGTEAVESRDPGLAVVIVQPLVDPARELACGPGGKGEHENLVATGDALTHRLLIEIYERMRLPRARSGEHTKWSVYFMDVEWQQVSRGGAGDLIMRARVSWSQPRPLKAQLPKGAEPRTARSRPTATA